MGAALLFCKLKTTYLDVNKIILFFRWLANNYLRYFIVVLQLYQNTDQAGGAFVDDFAEGVGEFFAGVVGHMGELRGHAVGEVLVEGFAKHIVFPDAVLVVVKLIGEILRHLGGLLLRADDGAKPSFRLRWRRS